MTRRTKLEGIPLEQFSRDGIISTRRMLEQLIAKADHPTPSIWQRIAGFVQTQIIAREDSPA